MPFCTKVRTGRIIRWMRTRYGTGESGIERDLGVCELYVLAAEKTIRLLQPMTQDERWLASQESRIF